MTTEAEKLVSELRAEIRRLKAAVKRAAKRPSVIRSDDDVRTIAYLRAENDRLYRELAALSRQNDV